ncbi:Regulatory protein leu3 [Knufia fluminis]|uniref:Regulatory protein leu3 n=1 Tax=Knufia fluminis TaxID=191047 RepID=A0AAN8EKZ9_9EURO|nr:Regulatory protein leu3 [Knufia fluminis]
MSSEIQQLREALINTPPADSSFSQVSQSLEGSAVPINWVPPLSSASRDNVESPPQPSHLSQSESTVSRGASSAAYRSIGDVELTIGQVSEHFRTYFRRCHRHLSFELKTRDPDEIYSSSPLLFWAIIAAASCWKVQSQLDNEVKTLVAATLHSNRSIQTIQALLILCVWPFRISRLQEDPSHFYIGLASQMCLQLGLHRPSQPYSHLGDRHEAMAGDAHIKSTTSLACFVVNQMQSSYLGVPSSILVDLNLIKSFDHPRVDSTLSQLCRIYHVLSQSCLAIAANGPTPSGLLAPDARLNMMKLCGEQLSTLQAQYLGNMNDIVKTSFLYARLQIWSFALLDDIPMSKELIEIIKCAEEDACELIELCYGTNLSIGPYIVRQAMCYSAFVLARILQCPYDTQREVLEDNIERVCQAMSTTASTDNDIMRKVGPLLRALPYIEDKRRSPPILSRMSASIVYDSIKMYWENMDERNPDQGPYTLDFDGFDWDTLVL